MKALRRMLIVGTAVVVSFTGLIAAQTVVTGTGNPDIDIAAVQAAVDRGGAVELRGHFSFDNPPAMHGELPDLMATVLVSKAVTISGTWDEHGEMTVIQGGEIPFAVEARGAAVRIERLRFVRPKYLAIFVDEVSGLAIESCTIEDVQPMLHPGNSSGLTSGIGIFVSTVMGLPVPDRRGVPGNVSGKLAILNNQISGVGAADAGMGIMVANVGDQEKPVDVDISGNTIRDSSMRGINMMQIGGQARIERNTVATSVIYAGRAGGRFSGIHCGGSGAYRIAHNVIDVADPNAAGICVKDYPVLGAAIERATITENDVTMSPPEGAVFGVGSAGIEVLGLARGTVVQGNRIRGRARVGISVAPGRIGAPAGSTFDRNDHEHLITTRADRGTQK